MGESWRTRTQMVHGGSRRSGFGETSEALFLTSGFRYLRAEDAADRFADRAPGYTYSRVANPTVRMFEERLALLEGAEEAAATATGMAAVHAALMSQLRAGDRVVAARLLFGSCRYILSEILPRFGVEVTLVDGADLDEWAAALAAPARLVLFETPGNPDARADRHRRRRRAGASGRRPGDRRQRVRDAGPAAAARARRRSRGVFRDQAHRRAGPLPRRRDLERPDAARRGAAAVPQAHRPRAQPVQCLGAAERPRDAGPARAPALPECPGDRPVPRGACGRAGGALPRPAESPPARAGAPADERGRRHGGAAHRRRPGARVRRAQPPPADRDLQQPGRRQVPDHPSGDHDASALQRRRARAPGHHRRPAAALGRPRRPGRSDRGPRPGARRRETGFARCASTGARIPARE